MAYSRPPSGKKESWPYHTAADLEAAGYSFVEKARCRGQHCHREIEFWRTPRQKLIPLDSGTMVPHFATCPDAKEFHRD